jgi:tetratricopeptide (TPR) repeat protein
VLLVTSRVVLHMTGERVYPVEPLSLDDAVALFHRRAGAADGRFRAIAEDKSAIEGICQRLDGLPLAIELAATRIRALSPAALLERLQPRLQLLATAPGDRPARQRTLQATLAWSVDLLAPDERRDFVRFSIFVGGCTLEAAEAVTETTVERFCTLVDHSLVRHERAGVASRYTMLETVREFASAERSSEEEAWLARRHAEYFVGLGEAIDALSGAEREAAQQRLPPELDNLRAAFAWAVQCDAELALRLAWIAALFLVPTDELRGWLDKALALPGEAATVHRARALHAAAHFAARAEEPTRSRNLWCQALELYRIFRDEPGVARALAGLGLAASHEGDAEAARSLYADSLSLYRSLGDQDGEWIVANNLGELERAEGNYERATELFESALAAASASGDSEAIAMSLHGLGDLALVQGQTAKALIRYRDSVTTAAPLAGRGQLLCWSLAAVASIAGAGGDVERAGLLWGGTETLEKQVGMQLPSDVRHRYRRPLGQLSPEALEAATARGRKLPLDQVIALALE